jgi:hypothetical protein
MSYVDFVTNAAVLEDVDLRKHLSPLMNHGLPLQLLPSFLHEAAHHWCFMSPVGNALTLLRMRTYRRLLRMRSQGNTDSLDLLEDYHRYETTVALMRPLAEGIACFEEFDSMCGGSNILSPAMTAAMWSFDQNNNLPRSPNPLPEDKGKFFAARVFSLFCHTRLHYDELRQLWVDRREDVLTGPFSLEGGGYLPGYLAVKSFWRHAFLKVGKQLDDELFLSHLKSYFYDDYVLVGIILDPEKSFSDSVNQIAGYFQRRFRDYFKLSLDQALADYEKSYTSPENGMPSFKDRSRHFSPRYDGLGVSSRDADRGQQRLGDLFDQVLGAIEGMSLEEMELCLADKGRQRRRELLCIGSTDVRVEVDGAQRMVVVPLANGIRTEEPMLAGEALADAEPGKGDGAIEAYMLPGTMGRAFLVSLNRECVWAHFDNAIPKEYRERLFLECGHRSEDLRQIRELDAELEAFLETDDAAELYREKTHDLDKQIADFYLTGAGFFIQGEDNWRELGPVLRGDGLVGVLNRDSAMVKSLALLGLVSSITVQKAEVAQVFQTHGLDLEAFLGAARSLQKARGVHLCAETGGTVLALI